MALNDPSEFTGNSLLQNALLGRAPLYNDECYMVARIMDNHINNGDILINAIAKYDRFQQHIPINAWRLVYCDLYFIDGSNTTLSDIYHERLREEELQTTAAQAREIVRRDTIKLARRNAKWMLSGLEKLTDEERAQEGLAFRQTLIKIWKQESHPPPPWIQHIINARKQWGFVYYASREVNQKYGHHWETMWERIQDMSAPQMTTYFSIHCQGHRLTLEKLATEEWPTFHANEQLSEDDDFRKHFNRHIEEKGNMLPAGILRNTFIVIPIEFIPILLEDDTSDNSEDDEPAPYWVWAYDADWDSSAEQMTFNGEAYQGRIKVAIYSLKSWFYAARWEGVSLRDMWLKAQQHQDKLWICYTKGMEEWDHQPYI
ncbi:uncharacterized protein FTOL_13636 [Fusarium torulosum]|uniref:Uncharacterized protein n=1 Tax=Fusarium torulosum TaxID=33205 RepID=A0AAE8SQ15_9HYPO|nr:uncharacterized protein FTOL_13636 [Fusarium torulosum]